MPMFPVFSGIPLVFGAAKVSTERKVEACKAPCECVERPPQE